MKLDQLFSIKGKTALVTGGSRGIGEMITAGFLANGVKVYITARKAGPLIDKAKELSDQYGQECIAIPSDLSSHGGVVEFADLLLLLAAWGPCTDGCPTDLDCNKDVGFSDLLLLLGGISICPNNPG